MTSLEAVLQVPMDRESGVTLQSTPPFETLYRDYFGLVWRTAKRLGVSPSALDDVVQETFVVVHRRLSDFSGRSSLKTWLYGILRRVIADHRRTQRRKPSAGGQIGPIERPIVEGVPASGDSPEASAQRADQIRLLGLLLDTLDDDKREVFVLAELEELTATQIATLIGANANTVASRLRAARKDFEHALERLTRSAPSRSIPPPPLSRRPR